MISLAELNAASAGEFVARLGGIFEHSPWVAARVAAQRPFASCRQLQEAMCAAVARATAAEQLALIRAHPTLGSRGRRAALTDNSAREQRRAGLDACTPEDFARLDRLNAAYLEKFAMPFILAVRGLDPAAIIDCFERRLANEAPVERRTALEEIGLIAGYRLADLVAA
jgi:OHCU decarboxylase